MKYVVLTLTFLISMNAQAAVEKCATLLTGLDKSINYVLFLVDRGLVTPETISKIQKTILTPEEFEFKGVNQGSKLSLLHGLQAAYKGGTLVQNWTELQSKVRQKAKDKGHIEKEVEVIKQDTKALWHMPVEISNTLTKRPARQASVLEGVGFTLKENIDVHAQAILMTEDQSATVDNFYVSSASIWNHPPPIGDSKNETQVIVGFGQDSLLKILNTKGRVLLELPLTDLVQDPQVLQRITGFFNKTKAFVANGESKVLLVDTHSQNGASDRSGWKAFLLNLTTKEAKELNIGELASEVFVGARGKILATKYVYSKNSWFKEFWYKMKSRPLFKYIKKIQIVDVESGEVLQEREWQGNPHHNFVGEHESGVMFVDGVNDKSFFYSSKNDAFTEFNGLGMDQVKYVVSTVNEDGQDIFYFTSRPFAGGGNGQGSIFAFNPSQDFISKTPFEIIKFSEKGYSKKLKNGQHVILFTAGKKFGIYNSEFGFREYSIDKFIYYILGIEEKGNQINLHFLGRQQAGDNVRDLVYELSGPNL